MVRRQIASSISVASGLGLRKCIRPVCGASAPGHNGVRASLVYKVGRTPERFSFPHRLKQRRLRPFTHTSICLANLRGKLYSSSEGVEKCGIARRMQASTLGIFSMPRFRPLQR